MSPQLSDAGLLARIKALCGTPCFVYDETSIRDRAQAARAFRAPFGFLPRYAMKACPTRAILQILREEGFGIDASSGFEVDRALRAGFAAEEISLSTQELPEDFATWVRQGVRLNACSLSQLERYGKTFPGSAVGIRFNPGLGSGGTGKTNVGGPSSSFGIWHGQREDVRRLLDRHSLRAERIHTHIGSGSDPAVWQKVVGLSLDLVREFPDVETLNLGGGYKVGRMPGEESSDIRSISEPVDRALREFANHDGRQIHLEIEPGTFLLANAGYLVATVQDTTETGPDGHRFLKLDAGMTELLRPSLYAAQHPIRIVRGDDKASAAEEQPHIVVGHCCESGDLLTPDPADAEKLAPRALPAAAIGDWCVIGGCGAYCSAMSAKNYNSFPEAAEVLLASDGTPRIIRNRQTLDQILANEI